MEKLGHPWPDPTKTTKSMCSFHQFPTVCNCIHFQLFPGIVICCCRVLQWFVIAEHFGNALPDWTKMALSIFSFHGCLTVHKKSTQSLTSFLRYCSLKNPAIWLDEHILDNNSRARFLPDMVFALENQ